MSRLLLCLWLSCLSLGVLEAQAPGQRVKLRLLAEADPVAAGEPFLVGLQMEHAPEVHTYWQNPGVGRPTTVAWEVPEGWQVGPTRWALPKAKKNALGGYDHIHEGTVVHLAEVTPPAGAAAGPHSLKAIVTWLECDADGCVPGRGQASIDLTVAPAAEPQPQAEALRRAQAELPQASDAWSVRATPTQSGYAITLEPKEGAAPDPGEIYFFDAAAAVANQPPEISREGDVLHLKLAGAPDATGPPEGFLHASRGWLADGSLPALAVAFQPDPVTGAAAPVEPGPSADDEVPAAAEAAGSGGLSPSTLAALSEIIPAEGPKYVTLDGTARAPLTYGWALLLAFVGGFILNAMPCVFPVLGIKVLGFVSQSGENPRKVRNHGLIFTLGLLVSLWTLAGVLIGLNLAGERLGWGFQQQSPGFTLFIVALLFVLGLNLAGVFEIGTSMTSVGGGLMSKEGYSGSFFTGVLTTLIATPCSGPFLGAAMGYTLQQPPFPALILFTGFGLGIALPYLILSLQPRLINGLPRPGPWMETFKVAMAFPMFATAIFFLNSFAGLTGQGGLIDALVVLLVLALALWIYGRWVTPMRSRRTRHLAAASALTFLALAAWQAAAAVRNVPEAAGYERQIGFLSDQLNSLLESGATFPENSAADAAQDDLEWQKWSPERVRDLRREGRILFADFTAKW